MSKWQVRFFIISVFFAPGVSLSMPTGGGGPFYFFGGRDIDYWGEGRTVRDTLSMGGGIDREANVSPRKPDGSSSSSEAPATSFSGASVVRSGDTKPFTWQSYASPDNPEFWDDGGDWIPPRPFREVVARPTSENVKAYLAWQKKKAGLLSRFQASLAEATSSAHTVTHPPAAYIASVSPIEFHDWAHLSVTYFYQATCPHCIRSRETIETVRSLGGRVTFVQLDFGAALPLHQPSVPYNAELARGLTVDATPTWLLSFGKKSQILTGSQTLAEVASAARALTGIGG